MNLAALCYETLRFTGVTRVARRLADGAIVLCYHNVVADDAPDRLGLHLPLAAFEQQMHWLKRHFTVVPLEEIAERVLRGKSLRQIAALTFDDAYQGMFETAWPLLRNLGLPATVFVVAEAPGRPDAYWWDHSGVLAVHTPERERYWLRDCKGDRATIVAAAGPDVPASDPPSCRRPAGWDTIASAARRSGGLDVGAHSLTHRSLPTLDDAELQREIAESRDIIRARIGKTPTLFAYPYGIWDERVRRAVQSAGYRAAVTLEPARALPRHDPLLLPRLNVPSRISHAAFQAWAAGLRPRRRQVV